MYKVLVNAYAVSPNWGSEPGMGWNWVSNLARFCDLYVITEGERQKEIKRSLNDAKIDDLSEENKPTKQINQADHVHFQPEKLAIVSRAKKTKESIWIS